MDPSTDLLSVYDQFDDDPLADPDYDAFEDPDEMEGEEILEEEGVQLDSEEILEQEEISQLEDIATGEIKILTRAAESEEEPIVTSGTDEVLLEQSIEAEGSDNTADSGPATEEQSDEEAPPTEETEAADKEKSGGEETREQTGGGEPTLDSLVNALMSAAELQSQAQPAKEE